MNSLKQFIYNLHSNNTILTEKQQRNINMLFDKLIYGDENFPSYLYEEEQENKNDFISFFNTLTTDDNKKEVIKSTRITISSTFNSVNDINQFIKTSSNLKTTIENRAKKKKGSIKQESIKTIVDTINSNTNEVKEKFNGLLDKFYTEKTINEIIDKSKESIDAVKDILATKCFDFDKKTIDEKLLNEYTKFNSVSFEDFIESSKEFTKILGEVRDIDRKFGSESKELLKNFDTDLNKIVDNKRKKDFYKKILTQFRENTKKLQDVLENNYIYSGIYRLTFVLHQLVYAELIFNNSDANEDSINRYIKEYETFINEECNRYETNKPNTPEKSAAEFEKNNKKVEKEAKKIINNEETEKGDDIPEEFKEDYDKLLELENKAIKNKVVQAVLNDLKNVGTLKGDENNLKKIFETTLKYFITTNDKTKPVLNQIASTANETTLAGLNIIIMGCVTIKDRGQKTETITKILAPIEKLITDNKFDKMFVPQKNDNDKDKKNDKKNDKK